jgi:hypothetical protein
MSDQPPESDKTLPRRILVELDLAEAGALVSAALQVAEAIAINDEGLAGPEFAAAAHVRALLIHGVSQICDAMHADTEPAPVSMTLARAIMRYLTNLYLRS